MIGARLLDKLETVLPAALLRAGEIVRAAAAERCPRKSGALAESVLSELEGDASIAIGTAVPYAASIELGKATQPARPFLRPALLESRDLVFSELARSLRERSDHE